MKTLLLVSVLVLSSISFTQDTVLRHCNFALKEVPQSRASCFAYVVPQDDSTFWVQQYRRDSSQYLEATFEDAALKIKKGKCYYYYDNDSLRSFGNFVDNEKEGLWKFYWEDGKANQEGTYKVGKPHGEWLYYRADGSLSSREQYEVGERLSSEWYDESGKAFTPKETDEYDPEFPGGEAALMRYIADNVKYPEISMEMAEQGTVYIQFVVEEDGELTSFKVIRGVSDALDKEALRVMKSMPKWKPGFLHNRKQKVRFTLPVTFSLR